MEVGRRGQIQTVYVGRLHTWYEKGVKEAAEVLAGTSGRMELAVSTGESENVGWTYEGFSFGRHIFRLLCL